MSTTEAPVIALLGAGSGAGVALARRFGRDGYRVALVARRREPLEQLAGTLRDEGIDAVAFPADLSTADEAVGVLKRIGGAFGRIDVLHFAPADNWGFTPATDLSADQVAELAELLLYTPIRVARAVLPEMLERGSGAILVSHGRSAITGLPAGGPGVLMAATRNYLQGLHAEVADRGVFVGTIAIGAMITGSALHRQIVAGTDGPLPFGVIDPADIAEAYHSMVTAAGPFERLLPPQ